MAEEVRTTVNGESDGRLSFMSPWILFCNDYVYHVYSTEKSLPCSKRLLLSNCSSTVQIPVLIVSTSLKRISLEKGISSKNTRTSSRDEKLIFTETKHGGLSPLVIKFCIGWNYVLLLLLVQSTPAAPYQ